MTYAGRSLLISGDTYGRDIGDSPETCEAAESEMVQRASAIPIKSDVLIAPHHGADNGSSACFIKAVAPTYVIFSAGHAHKHPRSTTVQRYLDEGVAVDKIFRTDLGDNEGAEEWSRGAGAGDKAGDDNVVVRMSAEGVLHVEQ